MKDSELIYRPFGLKNTFPTAKKIMHRDVDEFPYQGIWVASGTQGAGKTLFIMSVLYDLLQKYPNVIVYSNIALNDVEYYKYSGLKDFEASNGKKGIIYVLDEIHCLYSSLESKKMSGSMLTVWSQNRKNKRLILSTSQRWNRVAKPIREQSSLNIECRGSLLPWVKKYRVIDTSLFDDNGRLPPDTPVDRWHFYIPKSAVMDMYDTYEIVKSTNEV